MPEILTFSNAGDKIEVVAAIIKKTGRIPMPDEITEDNEAKGADNLTNYAWLIREALKLAYPGRIATYGNPVRGEYKGKSGTWNNFGEFTPDGEINPNDRWRNKPQRLVKQALQD